MLSALLSLIVHMECMRWSNLILGWNPRVQPRGIFGGMINEIYLAFWSDTLLPTRRQLPEGFSNDGRLWGGIEH